MFIPARIRANSGHAPQFLHELRPSGPLEIGRYSDYSAVSDCSQESSRRSAAGQGIEADFSDQRDRETRADC